MSGSLMSVIQWLVSARIEFEQWGKMIQIANVAIFVPYWTWCKTKKNCGILSGKASKVKKVLIGITMDVMQMSDMAEFECEYCWESALLPNFGIFVLSCFRNNNQNYQRFEKKDVWKKGISGCDIDGSNPISKCSKYCVRLSAINNTKVSFCELWFNKSLAQEKNFGNDSFQKILKVNNCWLGPW